MRAGGDRGRGMGGLAGTGHASRALTAGFCQIGWHAAPAASRPGHTARLQEGMSAKHGRAASAAAPAALDKSFPSALRAARSTSCRASRHGIACLGCAARHHRRAGRRTLAYGRWSPRRRRPSTRGRGRCCTWCCRARQRTSTTWSWQTARPSGRISWKARWGICSRASARARASLCIGVGGQAPRASL